ncbi:ATP-dependent DNA ligase [Agromyces salentinus]|uniref:DUF7882 family protein n=1 Tax=Agromyces salentinus TaxID=269421 RepID=UPI001BA48C14|nr:ATP-dependent DNA ligase [Agromyces salentinus]
MGILTWNFTRTIELEDRALAHVRSVVFTKLRRGESFAYSWENTVERGSGRNSVWFGPDIPVTFEFFGERDIPLNPRWVRALMTAANSPGGLVLVPEPDQEPSDAPRAPDGPQAAARGRQAP